MAVYTQLERHDIELCLSHYMCGNVVDYHGIAQGVENTNYAVTTDRGKFILTIFEKRTSSEALPFVFSFMKETFEKGIHVPDVLLTKDHQQSFLFKNKSVALLSFLQGCGIESSDISKSLLFDVGVVLGQIHRSGEGLQLSRSNPMALDVSRTLFEQLKSNNYSEYEPLFNIISDEIDYLAQCRFSNLPQGPIHGDFFPDNIFINDEGRISGVIDFYYACCEIYIYDIALALNAFCFVDNVFRHEFYNMFLQGYQSVRILNDDEKTLLNDACRWAALRILVTRTYDLILHDPKNLVTPKDPYEYLKILNFYQKGGINAR